MPKGKANHLYQPGRTLPFRLSRSKIDLFSECPRCFYLDRRLGVGRPSLPGFSLNDAVDHLLKNEFDLLRKKGQAHELMEKYHIDAVPCDHPDLPVWRDDGNRFTGAKVLHTETNFWVDGIIDDVWQNREGELLIVDYKATSTVREISLEDKYKQGYKRQIEIYQWIFRQLGFKVSATGYFVFANAGKNRPSFDGRLEFELSIIAHRGDISWVEPRLLEIKRCLEAPVPPSPAAACEYCVYREAVQAATRPTVPLSLGPLFQ